MVNKFSIYKTITNEEMLYYTEIKNLMNSMKFERMQTKALVMSGLTAFFAYDPIALTVLPLEFRK